MDNNLELEKQVANFSRSAGVYLMRDDENVVIYVGKAKNLKARLRQYLNGSDERSQISFLLRRVRKIETVLTETEEQAFILERDLIAKYKPRYNIRLKDDKAYLSIRIDENVDWPRLELVRRVEQDGASYYGPYSFSYEVRELLDLINKLLPLRTCTDTVFYNRVRPCLEYQIKRCCGPCCLEIDRAEYAKWVRQAKSILEGKTDFLKKELENLMEVAANDLRFEDAANYRDRLAMLDNFKQGQKYLSTNADHKDIFALTREDTLAVVSILKFRFGRVAGVQNFSFKDLCIPDATVLQTVVEQFYSDKSEPINEIILPLKPESTELLRKNFKKIFSTKVEITIPERGLKYRLLKLAELNAKQHFISSFNIEERSQELAKSLAKLLKLKQLPRRVECIDISNLQGSDIVGAVVSFYDGLPDKTRYKRYRLDNFTKPNDFAAIAEVVTRRVRRGIEDNDLPDLLVIDGGEKQLMAAQNALGKFDCNLEIIALAKERAAVESKNKSAKFERIFMKEGSEPLALDLHSVAGRFLVALRDETHRFVITYHRERRTKRVLATRLSNIVGVGPERERRLLKHFISTKNIMTASSEEIARVGRMSKLLADKIKKHLAESE